MNTTDFAKKYTPSPALFLAAILIRGLFLFFVLWAVKDILQFILSGSTVYDCIYRLLTFPADLILSLFIVFLRFAPVMTTVWVDQTEVQIKRWFQKPSRYSISDYRFEFTKKIGNKTIKNEILYMSVRSENGIKKTFRLPFFRKTTFTALSSDIHAALTNDVPVEIRSEIAYDDLQSGRTELPFSRQRILRSEWKIFAISSAIIVATVTVVFLVHSFFEPLYWYFLLIACVFLLLGIPVSAIRIIYYKKKCPHHIYRHGTFLYFDDNRFSVSEIQTIRMTAVNVVSTSIFPKARMITILAGGKKYRYWIGSTRNLPRAEYQKLCNWMERAFINSASKVIYDQK